MYYTIFRHQHSILSFLIHKMLPATVKCFPPHSTIQNSRNITFSHAFHSQTVWHEQLSVKICKTQQKKPVTFTVEPKPSIEPLSEVIKLGLQEFCPFAEAM